MKKRQNALSFVAKCKIPTKDCAQPEGIENRVNEMKRNDSSEYGLEKKLTGEISCQI